LNTIREKLEFDPDPILLARAEIEYGFILRSVYGEFDSAKSALARAESAIQGLDNASIQIVRSDIHYNFGIISYGENRFEEALKQYNQAHSLRVKSNDLVRIADALGGIGVSKMMLNQSDAKRYLQKCLELREATGDAAGICRALTSLTVFSANHGEIQVAIQHQKRALEMQQQFGNPRELADTLNNLGFLERELGHLQTAKVHYQTALDLLNKNEIEPFETLLNNFRDIEQSLAL
jgi:tetratricopeptide (TPR) repeat protein